MQPLVRKRNGYRNYIRTLLRDRWGIEPNWKIDKKAPPVYAWVNQSSWAANCECGGSLVVELGEPYICPDCVNAAHKGAREVIFPENKHEIEEILLKRPYPKNRNWLVTETANDLRRQNIEHGDKV